MRKAALSGNTPLPPTPPAPTAVRRAPPVRHVVAPVYGCGYEEPVPQCTTACSRTRIRVRLVTQIALPQLPAVGYHPVKKTSRSEGPVHALVIQLVDAARGRWGPGRPEPTIRSGPSPQAG